MAEQFLTVSVSRDARALEKEFRRPFAVIAQAATDSVSQVSESALKKGRVNIGASGRFRGRWVSGLQAKQYPKGKKTSAFAKVYINHKFGGLASVFEFGARIRPKKRSLLWVPLPGTPKSVKLQSNFAAGRVQSSRKRATAANVGLAKGPLEYLKRPGRPPLLGVKVGRGKREKFKPLFVGLQGVTIRKRWEVQTIAKEEAAKLPELFERNIKKSGRE